MLDKLVQRIVDWGEYDDSRLVREVRQFSRFLKRNVSNAKRGEKHGHWLTVAPHVFVGFYEH